MSEVIRKANELAKAIAESEELKALRKAEEELFSDPEALELFREYQRLRQMLQFVNTPEVQKDYEEIYKKFSENEKGKNFLEASQKFAFLLDTVNSILKSGIEGGGCSGNCASCGGGV